MTLRRYGTTRMNSKKPSPPVYMETNDPRIATLRAMVNNIVGFMDDWRIDMLDKQDDEEQAWVDEHGS